MRVAAETFPVRKPKKKIQFLELNFFLSFGTEFLGTEFLRTEFLRTELLRTVFLSYKCITLGHRLVFKCDEFTLFALLFILG